MLQRDKYLRHIYEIVVVQSRDVTQTELADEVGICIQDYRNMATWSRTNRVALGWFIPFQERNKPVAISFVGERSRSQELNEGIGYDHGKVVCYRATQNLSGMIMNRVRSMSSDDPEYPFWLSQMGHAAAMVDSFSRLG